MRKTPLLVHLVFHPGSDSARDLARRVHLDLNADPLVPGLRVPTRFCGGEDSRPRPQPLDQAKRNFVAPLCDDALNASGEWSGFVGDLWESCQNSPHRCVPIQLSKSAWPLDQRMKGVSFLRAHDVEESIRPAFVVRRLVIELCRYLCGEEIGGDQAPAPVRLFVSHTKLDLAKPGAAPGVVKSLTAHLDAFNPVKGWVDSGDVPAGSEFAKEIDQGVANTSLLCVLTDHYASREWCRKEVLLAKEKQRPVVVIDSLDGYEVRSFPYLGNVPVLRWNKNPEAATDLLLKETLRHLQTRLGLRQWEQPGDTVFASPPELATLVGRSRSETVLYPDPPVGVEEKNLLEKTGVPVTTPLERFAKRRSLRGKAIALSMSESTDIHRFGLDDVHQTDAMLELSRYLLVSGATLAYGGHLGDEGYTQKLFELVRTYNERAVQPVERIVNYLGWPLPRPDDHTKSKFKWQATLKLIARPEGVDESLHQDFVENPAFFPGDRSALHRYAWARGMTAMREAQIGETRARIALGGVFGPTIGARPDGTGAKWYFGRIPGVLEEILLSARAGQPVFLIGAFGGLARLAIDLLEGRDRHEATWEYQRAAPHAREMRTIFEERGESWWDYPEMTEFLRNKGVAGINPLLDVQDHRELFHTQDPVRMVELVLTGLGRLDA